MKHKKRSEIKNERGGREEERKRRREAIIVNEAQKKTEGWTKGEKKRENEKGGKVKEVK